MSNQKILENQKRLADYAVFEAYTLGRKHKEAEHPYRSIYERDRDRIIHCAAFRRLEYKTQVFVIIEGDYYRTRLTHTLEVAQIGRTIAGALGLNEVLVEAIALAHDLGHTPFGHAGENALNDIMKEYGGFNHNVQSLRVVDELEERYPNFKGLNLTWETREGIIRHSSVYDKSGELKEFTKYPSASLETQVVDISDEIAYDNHDLDDALVAGLISDKDLNRVKLWHDIRLNQLSRYPNVEPNIIKYQIIKELINKQVTDIIKQSKENIALYKIKSVGDVRRCGKKVISFSKNMQEERRPLRDFIFDNFYENYRVMRMSNKAKRFIEELFVAYLKDPRQLPPEWHARLKGKKDKKTLKFLLCDYIAGMTDRCALDEYKKLFDPYEKV